MTFKSHKWYLAFDEAEEYFKEEVQKLIDALTLREKALRNAETSDSLPDSLLE